LIDVEEEEESGPEEAECVRRRKNPRRLAASKRPQAQVDLEFSEKEEEEEKEEDKDSKLGDEDKKSVGDIEIIELD
jgi:hypothetical protein